VKKSLFVVMAIVCSFFGIKNVSADEIYLEYETNINEVKPFITEIGYETLNLRINELISFYEKNYSNDYPFYFIVLDENLIQLTFFDEIDYSSSFYTSTRYYYNLPHSHSKFGQLNYVYDNNTNAFSDIGVSLNGGSLRSIFSFFTFYEFDPYSYYYSNFDYFYKGTLLTEDFSVYLQPDDTLYVQSFKDSNLYSVHDANSDFLIEPYYLYDDNDAFKTEVGSYVTIDLNNYSYVALSLKNYDQDAFETMVYVKGQYCLTPVYNFGMTERKDILDGTQVDRCSPYYENFTPIRTYILDNDLNNNSIYYLKSYDKSKENLVKVDLSVFDVTYITEDKKDDPYVTISGKTYPTIPYDELTDTSTKSEDEGYVSGKVEDFTFGDFFDKPLEALKDVYNAIVSVFAIITEFILLLPPTMQAFLYTAFGIAIVLGIIKILL